MRKFFSHRDALVHDGLPSQSQEDSFFKDVKVDSTHLPKKIDSKEIVLDYFSHEIRTLAHALTDNIALLKEAAQQLDEGVTVKDKVDNTSLDVETIFSNLLGVEKNLTKILSDCKEGLKKLKLLQKMPEPTSADRQHDEIINILSEFLKRLISTEIQKDLNKLISKAHELSKTELVDHIKVLVLNFNKEVNEFHDQFKKICIAVNVNLTSKPRSPMEIKLTAEPASTDSERLPKLNVLIVDDSDVNLKLLGRILDKRGYHYQLAKNGQEAVDKFTEGQYDIILMDLQMPVMDGYEATVKIRQLEEMEFRGHTPIVALSANDPGQHRERALALGMDDFLSKPCSAADIYSVIKKHVNLEIPSPTRSECEAEQGSPPHPSMLKALDTCTEKDMPAPATTQVSKFRFHLMPLPNPKSTLPQPVDGIVKNISVECSA